MQENDHFSLRQGGEKVDELLLRRAQNGDPDAFEALLTPLENLIWRVCWHFTGDREAAAVPPAASDMAKSNSSISPSVSSAASGTAA